MAADTRDRILAAAARLYAEPASGGPALRAIAREGGVNSALIHYHFGSREGLFEAVLLHALAPLQARRAPILESLRTGRSADGADLAQLCVEPVARLFADEGAAYEAPLRLLARAHAEHRERLDALVVQHFGSLLFSLRDVLASALPGLTADVKQHRFRLAADAALTLLVGDAAATARAAGEDASERHARELQTFLAGALDAPS